MEIGEALGERQTILGGWIDIRGVKLFNLNLYIFIFHFRNWKDDKHNGFGRLIMNNGNVYEGDWEDGMFNGVGEYI